MAAAPARPPEYSFGWPPYHSPLVPQPTSHAADLSPPLIAMIAVVGTAFLIVLYVRLLSRPLRRLRSRWRRWRRRRRLLSLSPSDLDSSPAFPGAAAAVDYYYYYSSVGSSSYFLTPYGLDDAAIKTLPLSIYSKSKGKHLYRDCAVCLLEFDDGDSLRTLPLCSHVFHADCIDIWLRSHANCPLCRTAIFRQDSSPSPFIPMRAARIRPSFDDLLLNTSQLAPNPLPPPPPPLPPMISEHESAEIVPDAVASPARRSGEEEQFGGRDFLLERSYSFGFERNIASDRMMMMMDASTASPWRYRHRSFWSKRWPSPFIGGGGSSSSRAARVFSFRSYRGVNVRSPIPRKRGTFFPMSESRAGGGFRPSSRRTRSLTSPVAFFSSPWGGASVAATGGGFGSSRLTCGDPEALLSPERLNRR